MKNRNHFRYFLVGAMTVFPFLNGCTQQGLGGASPYRVTLSDAPTTVTPAPVAEPTSPPPVAAEPVAAAAAPVAPAPASAAPENVAEPLIVTNSPPPVMPEKLRVSKALGDVIQLAQSSVDEAVILTYVTNSPAAFLLGAEEIIYLKDIGVSSAVITSMMQRDQSLKTSWGIADAAPAVVPLTNAPALAAAPTYANPPQASPVPEAPAAVVADDYFEDSLSPYGTWVVINGYGRCWRPTVVVRNPGWRPYCDDGRWVYTDYGWYWMSDYSWGSVAFHYGRWFNDPRWGWCWWPDRVWGPSWVTWRYDNANCGWAPLPPNSIYSPGIGFTYFGSSVGASFGFSLGVGAYTFVPWGRFCDPYPYRYCLPPARSVAIYNQTTIINNYGNGNNTTVINRGISPDRVREHGRTEVRTVTLRTEPTVGGSPRVDRFEAGGRTLVVNRPTPFQPASGTTVSSAPGNTSRLSSPRDTASNRNEPGRPMRPAPVVSQGNGSSAAPVTPNEGRVATPRSQGSGSVSAPATPTPVTRPTPIFNKPITVERRPTVSAPANQPIIVGGSKSGQTSGRDYSVWSTPNPRPAQNSSSAPTATAPFSGGQSVGGNAPQNSTPPSSPRTSELNRAQPTDRSARPRFEERRPTQNYSAPSTFTPRATAPVVINPTPTPTPPAPARPSYTPTPSAPRSPAAPAAPSRSDSPRSDTRPDGGRPSRNR